MVEIDTNEIPIDAEPGARYLIVKIDEPDKIKESDELNNTIVAPIRVGADC